MKNLKKIQEYLKSRSTEEVKGYYVPRIWNFFNFQNILSGDKIIEVNPFQFYSTAIDYIIKNSKSKIQAGKSLSLATKIDDNGKWINDSLIYSLQIRTSTAFNHLHPNFKSDGTFFKTIALIPYLLHLGINTLYLLPISKISKTHKKGELGSPYSVNDFFALEDELADPMLENFSIDEQFSALVEALHLANIRIVLDFIPRTNARDSALLLTHPEWFYFIKKTDLNKYIAPSVPALGAITTPNPKHAKDIYKSPEVLDFLSLFCLDPKTANPKEWKEILATYNKKHSFLEHLENKTGLTVAPAFSDNVNDPQPPWNDVTYLRLFLDYPESANKYLKKKYPPYILFDVAKASLNPGKIPNQELWNLIASIIPYYQEKFGIDGARIDMGHALPLTLNKSILTKARQVDPSFAFIAEELDNNKAKDAKKGGYNMIIGDGFYKLPRTQDFLFHQFVYEAAGFPLPLLAQAESHDTPRAITRVGTDIFAKFILGFSLFIPNTIPFINSGQELKEKQPMNLGLDSSSTSNEGKLALFDRFFFDYAQESYDLIALLNILADIRKTIRSERTMPLGFLHMREHGAGFAFLHDDCAYLVVGHTNFNDGENLTVRFDNVKKALNKEKNSCQIIYSTHEIVRTIYSFNHDGSLKLWMYPGEIKIIKY